MELVHKLVEHRQPTPIAFSKLAIKELRASLPKTPVLLEGNHGRKDRYNLAKNIDIAVVAVAVTIFIHSQLQCYEDHKGNAQVRLFPEELAQKIVSGVVKYHGSVALEIEMACLRRSAAREIRVDSVVKHSGGSGDERSTAVEVENAADVR